ncbi:MAG TPA: peptide chain release factor N(5)-glutamine methyltransferase [Caldimonas sp.]|jgi:release factor glutamine methyltransferase|nr:peptide chain release factor N(5)-glutamine methyltransferase [Caldimonas sp.]HEX2540898.1 peptide chain release factor N(5)-glutamine methyltransferase [Caldimonas sp.]
MSARRCDDALLEARRSGIDALDAQLLMAGALRTSRSAVIAHGERVLQPAEQAQWQEWVRRRSSGEPLAYLLGEKEFHGLGLEITDDVLVPRPETELLVDWALSLMAGGSDAPTVVDLGTGSGAVALAIKHRRPAARVTATDISLAALRVAARNAERLDLELEFLAGAWWRPAAGRRFHLAVANPPYVAADDPHLAALAHEPRGALTPGGDGLAALREIIDGADAHLEPGGWLLVEHGFDQAGAVRDRMTAAGLTDAQTRTDLADQPRVTAARRRAATA